METGRGISRFPAIKVFGLHMAGQAGQALWGTNDSFEFEEREKQGFTGDIQLGTVLCCVWSHVHFQHRNVQ